jgi:benzoyl-CoA reductase/2-hydroxyglutaryl-CoA dehydratase subunit BcrC/BadD/HgdB
MNLLEKLIETNEARIKRIDENPDPNKLRSNRLGYELENDLYKAQLDAWKNGKPIFVNTLNWPFWRAMGFQPIIYPQIVHHFMSEASKYRQIIRNNGIPDYACDYLIYGMAMALAGDVPTPSFLHVTNGFCFVETYLQKLFAERLGVPYFEQEVPMIYNEENIKYMADGLGKVIEFVENKVPGVKYDLEKHIQLLEAEHIWLAYVRKEWNLRKNVPCPLSNKEMFSTTIARTPKGSPDISKGIKYMQMRLDEIEERVVKGVRREEKMRVLWIHTYPLYMNMANLLEAQGVTAIRVVGQIGSLVERWGGKGETKEFGRKLSPLEETARLHMNSNNRKTGQGWVDTMLWACKDQNCDGIICYQFTGCTPMASLHKVLADQAEKKLGVSTLIIPGGSPMDPASIPPEEVESRIVEFINMVLAKKRLG